MKYPINEVKITWPIQVTNEIFPTSRTISGFKVKPTMKRRIDIQILEKSSSDSWECRRFRKYGPTRMPVAMYPTIRGCLRIRMNKARSEAKTKISESSMNIGIEIL